MSTGPEGGSPALQPRECAREGGGGGECVYQKWPDKIFPTVNFVFSHDGHFGLGQGCPGGGGGSSYGCQPF